MNCPVCKAEFKIDPEEISHARQTLKHATELLKYLEPLLECLEKLDIALTESEPLKKRIADMIQKGKGEL